MAEQTKEEIESALKVIYDFNEQHPQITEDADFTDTGNAKMLVTMFGDRIRYCHPWKSWLCWNGKIWERDNSGQIFRYAKLAVETSLTNAENGLKSNPNGSMELKQRRHALTSMSLTKLKAMVTLAESEGGVSILPDDLDKDIWLLNVQNGVLNLKTGLLQEHRREDYITKISPVVYDAGAKCERWMAFLDRIFEGKQELIEYVQKVTGQTLTGDASEQQLFIFWGGGANGKGTVIETIAYILSDYSRTIAIESLMKKDRSSVSNDIARLKGARLVYANEPEFGDHISEGKVKSLTGRDTIQARFLFQENFQFKPEFKLIISTNHKPIIKGMDHGIWRRIKLVPFGVTIPEPERDKSLDIKLQTEASGILNWLIQGCRLWQQTGLVAPKEVSDATEEYQRDMDSLADFISDSCEIGDPDYFVSHRDIYLVYCSWSKSNVIRTMSKKLFSMKLVEKGFSKDKDQNIRGFHGLKLNDYLVDILAKIERAELPQDYLDQCSFEGLNQSNGIGERITKLLKEKYDYFNKPDSILDLGRLQKTMEGEILNEVDGSENVNVMRCVEDYCKERDKDSWHVPQVLKMKVFRDIIQQLQDEHKGAVPLDVIISKTAQAGIRQEATTDMLMKLKSAGDIIEASEGRFRVV